MTFIVEESLLSHSNTLKPWHTQMLLAEMLEKFAHFHSSITSDGLLNQESTLSYENRASWSNFTRKVLNQTRPSGGFEEEYCDFWTKINILADKNAFMLFCNGPWATDSFACSTRVMCHVKTYALDDGYENIIFTSS